MKSLCAAAALFSVAVVSFGAAGDYQPPREGFDFPIYRNNPPGNMLPNDPVRRAASTPALAPDETRKLIQVPPGFEVRLFAAEPMVVNPVAMTWDERGRLWVVELYEYPKGAAKGAKGRDRIKVLEDTDADGKADKVTVFADGFSLATGIALGNGGVYLGQAPHLYFLKDTNGDDKADSQEIILTGFGMEDRHELLNGFAWGPDGWLYMTHGVFTHSKVKPPAGADPTGHDPDGFGVQMDAALARFHPVTKKFEVFADGTSNPWGVDWNERGDAFVSACVIQHLFHMAPGGLYNRQGGTWPNPYGYVQDLPTKGLPAIVDFRHYRAAHAGIAIYQGDQWPAEWRGLVFLGNIHQNALNVDRLTPVGATYKAEKESTLLGPAGEALRKKTGEKVEKGEEWRHLGPGNFFVSRDPWVRPVSNQTGPDGAMWVMDWYDKYPCYQNAQADPEGVDREYGRIWRVVWTGDQPGKAVASRPSKEMDLTKLNRKELAMMLGHSNSWHQRQARRLFAKAPDFEFSSGHATQLIRNSSNALLRLNMAQAIDLSSDSQLSWLAEDASPDVRAWSAQTTGRLRRQLDSSKTNIDAMTLAWAGAPRNSVEEADHAKFKAAAAQRHAERLEVTLKRLVKSAQDSEPQVRAAVAVALRQFTAGSLTVNDLSCIPMNDAQFANVVAPLLARPSVPADTYYPHIVWMAMEPRVAADPTPFFPLLAANDNSVSAYCARRVMRRICDLSDATARARHLDAAVQWLGDQAAKTQLAAAAVDGLLEAFKSKGAPPTIDLAPIFAKLNSYPALAEKAQRLAAVFGDQSAARLLMAKINDPKASLDDRLKGINAAKEVKGDAARDELLKLIKSPLGGAQAASPQLKSEAVRAVIALGYDNAYPVVDAWPQFAPMTRLAAAEALTRSTKTSRALLAGVERSVISPRDISATTRRSLANSEDKTIADNADKLLGKYRASGADKVKLIAEKRAVVLNGTADLKNGLEVAKRACFVCHKMYGEGTDIGPDLTGVGRSTLDALLHNVIDPNEVIGNGNETTEVETKDGTTYTGRVVEESDTRIKLVNAGPVEYVIAKSDIAVVNGKPKITKKEMSLMPEGLEQMPDKDLRDLLMFILNPPGDQRPWTPALRKELIGDEPAKAAQR
jgi:putative membrane-bound dehydrogenase-like protein